MFRKFILQAEKSYCFQLKSTVELTDDMMDQIERTIFKHRPSSISAPKRMMFQASPFGFTGVAGKEVWVVDLELTLPVTSTHLEYDLRNVLGQGKNDNRFIVLGNDDPREEDETGETEEEILKQEDEEPTSILRNENFEEVEQPDFKEYFGDEYNVSFTNFLKEYEVERKQKTKAGSCDPHSPLIKNGDMPELGSDLHPEQDDKS